MDEKNETSNQSELFIISVYQVIGSQMLFGFSTVIDKKRYSKMKSTHDTANVVISPNG